MKNKSFRTSNLGWGILSLVIILFILSIHLRTSAAPKDLLVIPHSTEKVTLDGTCQNSEYPDALKYEFTDAKDSLAVIRLQHDTQYLYICFKGVTGEHSDRFVSVYLDTNGAGESIAQADDYSLRVYLENGNTLSKRGTGAYNGYEAFELRGWDAATGANKSRERAEYAIPISFLGASCGAPFRLAVYHQWVTAVGNDYGWPTAQYFDQPQTWRAVVLENDFCEETTTAQLEAWHQLKADSLRTPRIRFEAGVPRFVSIKVPVNEAHAKDPILQALDYLETYRELYQLSDPAGQLFLSRSEGSSGEIINPMFHVFFGQQFAGIPVYGAELGVHIAMGNEL